MSRFCWLIPLLAAALPVSFGGASPALAQFGPPPGPAETASSMPMSRAWSALPQSQHGGAVQQPSLPPRPQTLTPPQQRYAAPNYAGMTSGHRYAQPYPSQPNGTANVAVPPRHWQNRYAQANPGQGGFLPQGEDLPSPGEGGYDGGNSVPGGDPGCGGPAGGNWGGPAAQGCGGGGCYSGDGGGCYSGDCYSGGCSTGGCYGGGCATGSCFGGGCATGGCYDGACGYGNFGYGCGNSYNNGWGNNGWGMGPGLGLNCQQSCTPRRWHLGVYGLIMSRDKPAYQRFAALVDNTSGGFFFPDAADTILCTCDVAPEFEGGVEIRLGASFLDACGGYHGHCDYGGGTYGAAASWEVVYWSLAEGEQTSIATDAFADTDRLITTVNFNGIEIDRDGAAGSSYGWREAHNYWDGCIPVQDNSGDPTAIRVLGMRLRNRFKAHNLELNFYRSTFDCIPRTGGQWGFTYNSTCGVRHFQLDEELQFAAMFSDPTVGTDVSTFTNFSSDSNQVLFYDLTTDNSLTGFQFGNNLNWRLGCRWDAFCNTNIGIYGNRIRSRQRMLVGGGGEARFNNSLAPVDVESDKTDVSFLGECRLGLSWQVNCRCRWTTTYRVLSITGVALSGEQIPQDFSNPELVGWIDSNDSILLHGVQTGLEWQF